MNQAPSPSQLLAFVRAAELGSFARASSVLGTSPAAVAQGVARLERSLGVKLLTRTTRRMSVTAEGRLLLERAGALLSELGELGRLFDEQQGVVSGPLHVSAPLGFARRHVLPIVARFTELHPAVEVTLDCSDAIRDMVGDHIDVAFRIARPLEGNFVAVRLARLSTITVASPAHLRRHGTPRDPAALAERPCIVYRHPGTNVVEPLRFRVRGREQTIRPRVALTVNDVETGCEAAVLGMGIGQPPAYYVEQQLAAGSLVPILERHAPAPWALYLCYPSVRHLPRRVRAFVDFARAEIARAGLE